MRRKRKCSRCLLSSTARKIELLTERTRITLPGAEFAPQVLEYFVTNRAHFTPTYPPVKEDFYTLEGVEKTLLGSLERADKGTDFKFFVFDRHNPERIFANIGISQIARGPAQYATLGYSAAKSAEGKGLMFESVSRVIGFAFEELHLHRIQANHLPDNDRSAKILARLGFIREGLAKEYLFINGKWRDHVLNSLTNPDWRPSAAEKAYFASSAGPRDT
jgi:[ribosomal protein S5]-alanine N-acetyltransferase